VGGTGDKVSGTSKEWAGKATGDDQLESEGRTERKKGEVKDTAADARDSVKGAWEATKDAVRGDGR
jgi:uncharacterized protein YjbJ (UPF0337 family)